MKNKVNHQISSKSESTATQNEAIATNEEGLQNKWGHHIILTKCEAVIISDHFITFIHLSKIYK